MRRLCCTVGFPMSPLVISCVLVMGALRVLFLGSGGIISSACCRLAVQRGLDLYALNRGTIQLRPLPFDVTMLHGDVRDPVSVREALGRR